MSSITFERNFLLFGPNLRFSPVYRLSDDMTKRRRSRIVEINGLLQNPKRGAQNTNRLASLRSSAASYVRRNVIPKIADLRVAAVLLLILALASATGTFINQGREVDYYAEFYPVSPALFGFLTWEFVLNVGLDHVYSTWWFYALLTSLATSLTTCTFYRQLPALRSARKWRYYTEEKQIQTLPFHEKVEEGDLGTVAEVLQETGYTVFQKGNSVYGSKGLLGRISPIVVHASMLCVMAGSIVAALFGWQAQELVPSGSTFSIDNVISSGALALPRVPRDIPFHVNRFWIDYTSNGAIDQFFSDLSILDKSGNEIKRQTISVNHPLRYNGLYVYQTDWAIAGIMMRVNDSPDLALPMAKLPAVEGNIWATYIPVQEDLKRGISILAKDFNNVLVYDTTGKLAAVTRPGLSVEVEGVRLQFGELIGSTGLSFKDDPGIPIIFTGFGFLMVSTFTSFLSYSQVWATRDGKAVLVGGKTNRLKIQMRSEFLDLVAVLEDEANVRKGRRQKNAMAKKVSSRLTVADNEGDIQSDASNGKVSESKIV